MSNVGVRGFKYALLSQDDEKAMGIGAAIGARCQTKSTMKI